MIITPILILSASNITGMCLYFVFLMLGTYLCLQLENDIVVRTRTSMIETVMTTVQNIQITSILLSILLFGTLSKLIGFSYSVILFCVLLLTTISFVCFRDYTTRD